MASNSLKTIAFGRLFARRTFYLAFLFPPLRGLGSSRRRFLFSNERIPRHWVPVLNHGLAGGHLRGGGESQHSASEEREKGKEKVASGGSPLCSKARAILQVITLLPLFLVPAEGVSLHFAKMCPTEGRDWSSGIGRGSPG